MDVAMPRFQLQAVMALQGPGVRALRDFVAPCTGPQLHAEIKQKINMVLRAFSGPQWYGFWPSAELV